MRPKVTYLFVDILC